MNFSPVRSDGEQLEIQVISCGVCHADLSMLDNEWGTTRFPLVPGHEVIGRVVEAGDEVKRAKVGDNVGLGWFSRSCMSCSQCLSGNHNLCAANEQTIVGRHGGFANRVRCHWVWATPLPSNLDQMKSGPLFCGGITVFNPILQFGVLPVHRVGVIGIGGLGHLALQFLCKWGCDVTAFTTSDAKAAEAVSLGARRVLNTRDSGALEKAAGSLDFIISTVASDLGWPSYLNLLAPKGRLHFVGVPPSPIALHAFPLIAAQRSIGGSPLGSPATTGQMLDFCGRHGVAPITESFKLSEANQAIEHLRAGKARYRIVLENDLG
ncbi:MAG: NAD(P)-dependent alcohol dehydrogenase [Terrimicrobiaceae bacterium]|nr:NAD(P)-dependent alcohol dehydrogenase [Terrimicrobiaceae bacterium]